MCLQGYASFKTIACQVWLFSVQEVLKLKKQKTKSNKTFILWKRNIWMEWKKFIESPRAIPLSGVHDIITVLENIRVSLPKEHKRKRKKPNPSGNYHLGTSNVFVLMLGHQCRTVRAMWALYHMGEVHRGPWFSPGVLGLHFHHLANSSK